MIDIRVIAYPLRAFAHPACIRRLPGDIDTNIGGIKTEGQSCHVRAHTSYLRSLCLAHNVLNTSINLYKIL